MQDELSKELIDQIIFGMENQDSDFCFDLEKNIVLPSDQIDRDAPEDRFVSLPEWNSTMGFQLMERFATTLRNPIFRETLRECLSSGRGVFRKFKNALKDRPDIERLWFRFKEKEMRAHVYEWYNACREAYGLDPIEVGDADETEELVLSDFRIGTPVEADLRMLLDLDGSAFFEAYRELPEQVVEELYRRSRPGTEPEPDEIIVAETPKGEISAFLWFETEELDGDFRLVLLRQLYVMEEYRGLGLARTLIDRFVREAHDTNADFILTSTAGRFLGFDRTLRSLGFEPLCSGLILDVHRWGRENLV